jgi:dTDP-4-dehydrorhamnose 3,5-epimerase
MCIGPREALILNCPTEPYDAENPDEVRLDPHVNSIPYDWRRRDG